MSVNDPARKSVWKQAFLVFAIAFFAQSLTYAVIKWHNPAEVIDGDTPSYFACAEDFRKTGKFDSAACSVRTPVYPLLVAVTGSSAERPSPVIRLQHFFAAAVAALFAFFLLPFLGPRASCVWGVLFSLDALILRYTNTVMTEMPFLFFWALSWALLYRALATGRWFLPLFVCGLLQAAAVLTRPLALFWPVAQGILLLVFLFSSRGTNRRRFVVNVIVVFLYGAAALGIPQLWAYHNWKAHGYWSVARVGMDVLHHKSATILTTDLGVSLDQAHEILNERFHEKGVRGGISDAERDKLYREVLLETLWRHPAGFVRSAIRSARRVLFRGAVPEFAAKGQPGRTLHCVLNYLNVGWNVLLGCFALYFFLPHRRDPLLRSDAVKKFWLAISVLSILYFTLMVTPHGKARYRFPIVPAIYFLAVLGFHELRETRRARYNLKCQSHDLRAVSSAG
ncbi:MAG: ArnT family glycosyltransferase [Candidatus Omnitrophota bacterium]